MSDGAVIRSELKGSTEYQEGLLENEDKFSHPFFKRFTLKTSPLALDDRITKIYKFPTFYADVTASVGIFFCDWAAAKSILPHPAMNPVSMLRGRALVIFSNYIYRNVLNIPTYNETAMTIPVMVGQGVNVPILPVLNGTNKRFGYYCFGMPVTSLENKIRGNKIWGLPKTLNRIDMVVEDGNCRTAIYDGSDLVMSLDVPTSGGKQQDFDVSANLYSMLDGKLLQATTNFSGSFNVIKYPGQLWRKKYAEPPKPVLHIGTCAAADTLNKLKLEPHPFQFRYTPSMNACFDLPNEDFFPPTPPDAAAGITTES